MRLSHRSKSYAAQPLPTLAFSPILAPPILERWYINNGDQTDPARTQKESDGAQDEPEAEPKAKPKHHFMRKLFGALKLFVLN